MYIGLGDNMEKVTKYPKYKQEAYSRLDRMFKGILKESGFYTQHPEFKSEGLVFSYDPKENIKHQILVSIRGTTLIKVCKGELTYSIPNGIRLSLTKDERILLTKSLETMMRAGNKYVFTYLGTLKDWYISSEICRFCNIYGDTYINSKSYNPRVVNKTTK